MTINIMFIIIVKPVKKMKIIDISENPDFIYILNYF